jgi:hypothetical protein
MKSTFKRTIENDEFEFDSFKNHRTNNEFEFDLFKNHWKHNEFEFDLFKSYWKTMKNIETLKTLQKNRKTHGF